MNRECWQVWLLTDRKIASFHAVEGYRVRLFYHHDHFLSYMQELQERGFYFQ